MIAWIFVHPEAAVLYVAVMLAAATATAVRRIGCGWRLSGFVLVAILAGAALTVSVVAVTGALAWDVQAVLPFTAQMIGGAMTAALLAGSRMRDDAIQRWGEVEGYLALGASPRQALVPIGQSSVQASLAPALDQTKSAGLVLLPGSFVGLLLGGASPATAAQVQLLRARRPDPCPGSRVAAHDLPARTGHGHPQANGMACGPLITPAMHPRPITRDAQRSLFRPA